MQNIKELRKRHFAGGRVTWIGTRPERLAGMQTHDQLMLDLSGLAGDHAKEGPRALTLIQEEHLPVIAAFAGLGALHPSQLRRNVVISGINLISLRHDRLKLGSAEIRLSKPCSPCSRMEREIGKGVYNAMRGHGGWYAEVVSPGEIAVGDQLTPIHG